MTNDTLQRGIRENMGQVAHQLIQVMLVGFANLIDTELSRLGVVTQDIAEIDTIGSIVTCVRQGLGISVVPHVALQSSEDLEMTRLPFGTPQLVRQIGIVERSVSPRADIIGRIHQILADFSGEHGLGR